MVVISAIAGATNTLLKAASMSLEGQLDEAHARLNRLLERHVTIARISSTTELPFSSSS